MKENDNIQRVPIIAKSQDKKKRQKPTTKKIKVGTVEQGINPVTGEVEPVLMMDCREMDFNFKKFFVSQWLAMAEIFGKRGKLAFWIMDNIDASNKLCYTQQEIAQKTGVSLKTVQTTLALLTQHDFLQRERNGCYRINPNMIFKGNHSNRMNIWIQYSAMKKNGS